MYGMMYYIKLYLLYIYIYIICIIYIYIYNLVINYKLSCYQALLNPKCHDEQEVSPKVLGHVSFVACVRFAMSVLDSGCLIIFTGCNSPIKNSYSTCTIYSQPTSYGKVIFQSQPLKSKLYTLKITLKTFQNL